MLSFCDWIHNRSSIPAGAIIGGLCLALATVMFPPAAAGSQNADADAQPAAEDGEAYPFGLQLRVLARDLTSPEYHEVLATLIPTDLEAEWLRVATPDNYLTFLKQHGGRERVSADPGLQAAYERRKRVADDFLNLIRAAYSKRDRDPPFDAAGSVEKVLEQAAEIESENADPFQSAVPIRVVMPAAGAQRQWPRFRGPTGQGTATDTTFPLNWSDTEHIAWKTRLPGLGNSSPVIWDERVFVTCASEDGQQRSLVCISRHSGDVLWKRDAPPPQESEKLYWKNSYASSTPVTDGERIVAFFGNAGMVCFDFEGRQLWHRPLGPFVTMHGPGTSPVLYKDKVIFIQDQNRGESVFVALDKHTGETLWQQPRENAMGWSTPVVVRVGDHDELLYNGSFHVVGYNPETGEEIWRVAGSTREAIPMLVVGGGLIYSASGRNGPMLAIRPGGQGDATKTNLAWSTQRGAPHVPSPVYYNERLFCVNDLGIVTCLDGTNGATIWQKRLRGRFSMSPVEAGGRILLTNENGVTFVLQATDHYEPLAVNDLKETTLATPAVLGGRIYFRTSEHLICIAENATAGVD